VIQATERFAICSATICHATIHNPANLADKSQELATGKAPIQGDGGHWQQCTDLLRIDVSVVRDVAFDLVGHRSLGSLLDVTSDHFISCSYQQVCFPSRLHPPVFAKPCQSVGYLSM